ncbi:hypothetical protein HRE53_16945 [Acaryochloris sp. 'Moss Beach']|uniref:hypothetical protein n=1 Tax=Acaryochloris sp. 'Moss Beach' TaxID=2740837 RepID=UPI001F2DF6EB|nr:hypothetical protein [Acaryochloris sp. 'Moss Beach']UJB68252.1 hypothetical protein HRE53_16945 [Acaryochloris sp. 'Moss Beach']
MKYRQVSKKIGWAIALGIVGFTSSVQAQTASTTNQDQTNNNNNQLGATSVVNQSAHYAVGQAATYGFKGVVCPRPAFILSAGYDRASSDFNANINGSDSNAITASAAIVVPIGGSVGKSCTSLAKTMAKSSEMEMARNAVFFERDIAFACRELIDAGIAVTLEKFPTLSSSCSAIKVRRRSPNPSAQTPAPQSSSSSPKLEENLSSSAQSEPSASALKPSSYSASDLLNSSTSADSTTSKVENQESTASKS